MTQKEQAEGGHVAKTTVMLPSLPLTFPKTDFKKSEFIAGYFFKNISKVNIYQKYIIFL